MGYYEYGQNFKGHTLAATMNTSQELYYRHFNQQITDLKTVIKPIKTHYYE